MVDIFKNYKKKDPFYIRCGFMLLMFSLITWIMNGTDSYLNAGVLMFGIYLVQFIVEAIENKKVIQNDIK